MAMKSEVPGSSAPGARRLPVPVGIDERFATVHGNKMRYLTAGAGPPVLFIPGLLGFSFSFSENLAAFSEHFTVFAPDLLNTGYSDRADIPADLRSSVKQIVDFMDAVGISSAHIIGSSYGGTVALALAAIAPERVKTLVPVAPAHCGSEHGRWQVTLFSSGAGLWLSRFVRFAPPLLHGFFIKRMYGDSSRALPGTVAEYARAIEIDGTTLAAAKVMKSWKANFEELCGLMPKLAQQKTLLVWGDKDPVVPLKTAKELMKEMPRAQLAVIPTAGHLPYEELPEQFNKIVIKFLLAFGGGQEVVYTPRPA
jgi:pimeloyl-ACP methyl ester carboxylesterase